MFLGWCWVMFFWDGRWKRLWYFVVVWGIGGGSGGGFGGFVVAVIAGECSFATVVAC